MTTNFTRFDAAELLDSEEMIAAYLNEVLAENNPAKVIKALETIARARDMTKEALPADQAHPASPHATAGTRRA